MNLENRYMENELGIKDLVILAQKDIEEAANYDIGSDNGELAKEIYMNLFDFYSKKEFSGDVIFTWKSPSLVKNGDYIGKRDGPVNNKIVIGNIFPNYKTEHKYSLNLNRNGNNGDFPHDYFDIYLDHVAKYAYNEDRPQIMEYYPLKRAILYKNNKEFFDGFKDFKDFVMRNYLSEVCNELQKTSFLSMKFDEFQKVTNNLMYNRGILMLKQLIEKFASN